MMQLSSYYPHLPHLIFIPKHNICVKYPLALLIIDLDKLSKYMAGCNIPNANKDGE